MCQQVIKQLWDIYCFEELWHTSRLTYEQFDWYTTKLIKTGNIFYVETVEGKILGYTEVWRINYEQFGKLICGEPIDAAEHDVQTGKIAYVANVWCHPDYRRSWVIRYMREKYFLFTAGCEYHCGQALRKRTQPVKVFKTSNLKSFIKTAGASYGPEQDD